ncbi:MAG TPA: DMT family transporter [Streptosporangiaceae bacterium]|nr:DMT family transporter [Streptosporangiaceae bacterium]
MTNNRRLIFPALITAGILWGTTVPLSKVALGWMPPAWLAFARFALAAAILMVASRSRLRGAWSPAILISGGLGYGGSVLLQNLGIERTSVTHAALLIGATPVLVAIIAAALRHSVARPVAWAGFGLSLAGVTFIASGQGSGSTLGGDGLVLAAQLVSACFTVSQARLLRGRDPIAVTGLQLMSAAVLVLPIALTTEHHLAGSMSATAVLATIGLVVAGTVGPTALFAFGQSTVAADVAGAFLNIEPLVGAVMGTVLFADPLGPVQIAGGIAIMAGIGLSSYQVARGERLRRAGLAVASEIELVPASELALAAAREPAIPGIAPAAAVASLRKPGEAPSLVRRTRFPHLGQDAVRYARRPGPAAHASPSAGSGSRRSSASRRPGGVHQSATGQRRDGDASPDRQQRREPVQIP